MALQEFRQCPTFVINLDRRPDRWANFSAQPALAEFKQLQRFSAVDGANLNLLQDERISLHTRMNLVNRARRSHYEIATPGACGASFSHIGIWEQFLKSGAEYVVVFEDDTVVDQTSLAYIDALIPRLPTQWDMWLLGTHKWGLDGKALDPLNPKGWYTVSSFTGAHAYVLSRKGAELLLENPYPIETHIEYYITGCAKLKGLKLIKHWALRMTYFAEATEKDDSDTYDGWKSCPTCYIPDDYPKHGFYLSHSAVAGLVALTLVGAGALIGFARK